MQITIFKRLLFIFCMSAAHELYAWDKKQDEQVSSLVSQFINKKEAVGVTVAIYQQGELVFNKGYGYANLETNSKVTPQTIFPVASLTKQFTAAAIMLLVEEGKLKLSDPISKHLTDYPKGEEEISIHNLLSHTSGIPSYTGMGNKFWSKSKLDLTHQEIVDLFKGEKLKFKPGTWWAYSSSGYYLLGMIIEKVSGMTYDNFLTKNIFKPLGLKTSSYCDYKTIVKNRASGYDKTEAGWVNADYISMAPLFSAGGLCSTARDIAYWHTRLANGKLIAKSHYEKMSTPASLLDGTTIPYGYGLKVLNFEGSNQVTHGGKIKGFLSHMSHFPEKELTIAVLTNSTATNPKELGLAIAKVALANR